MDVCDTAKVRFFKQITTASTFCLRCNRMFVILQKYDFSSKSQLSQSSASKFSDVCDTAKVRFFKQITTDNDISEQRPMMFVILQKYDFSSKSQHQTNMIKTLSGCLWYCKSTIFQANHNSPRICRNIREDVCDTAKVRFFKQITTGSIN